MMATETKSPQPEEQPETNVDDSFEWRVESFLLLGFIEAQAEILAKAKDSKSVVIDGKRKRYEFPLHISRVKQMLEAGCDRNLIVSIFV